MRVGIRKTLLVLRVYKEYFISPVGKLRYVVRLTMVLNFLTSNISKATITETLGEYKYKSNCETKKKPQKTQFIPANINVLNEYKLALNNSASIK